MRLYFSPIVGDKKIEYKVEDQKLIVIQDELEDVFDFTEYPDGILRIGTIGTILPIQPIIYGEKKNGIMFLELINFITENASEFEKFPEWIETEAE